MRVRYIGNSDPFDKTAVIKTSAGFLRLGAEGEITTEEYGRLGRCVLQVIDVPASDSIGISDPVTDVTDFTTTSSTQSASGSSPSTPTMGI